MSAMAIQGALPLLGRAIGRNLHVQVKIGGKDAWTDHTSIHLPDLPLQDAEMGILAVGYLLHEAAHIRWTDFLGLDSFVSPFHNRVAGVFEDIRIETRLMVEYPGFRKDLTSLVAKLVRDGKVFGPPDADAHPAEKVRTWLLYALRSEVLEQVALTEYAEAAEKMVRDLLSEGTIVRLRSVMGRVGMAGSEVDCRDLAAEVLDIIDKDDENQEQGKKPPETDREQGDEPGLPPDQGGGKSGDDTGGCASQEPGDQGVDVPNAAGVPAGDGAGAKGQGILDATDEDLGTQDFGAALGGEVGKAAAEVPGALSAGVSHGDDSSFGIGDPAAILADCAGATGALKARLRRFLLAHDRTETSYRRRGRRIAANRVVRAAMGDRRVFVKNAQSVRPNTGVAILLDKSGSMTKMLDVASRAALAATAALETVRGVKVCTAAFPGTGHSVRVLTPFGKPVRGTAERYTALAGSGGTPLLGAFLWAADELLAQSVERRIVVIVTDGIPSQLESCRQAIDMAEAGGLEVAGIGISAKSKRIAELVQGGVCIDSVDGLPEALFAQLRTRLFKAA